jgi:hypothetical protein
MAIQTTIGDRMKGWLQTDMLKWMDRPHLEVYIIDPDIDLSMKWHNLKFRLYKRLFSLRGPIE